MYSLHIKIPTNYYRTMNEITDVTIVPLTESSDFVKPFRMRYAQTGRKKTWDLLLKKPGVAVIVYNITRNKLILVKQFRPAVYASALNRNATLLDQPNTTSLNIKEGITLELCAGMIDKPNKSPKEIAQSEVLEECGYDVPLAKFEHVITFLSGVGLAGEYMHLFYSEVTDQMCISEGGGLASEGELIDVVEMSHQEVQNYLGHSHIHSPMFTIYGLTWFLTNRINNGKSTFDILNVILGPVIGMLALGLGAMWVYS